MNESTHSYVAICDCGVMVGAIADDYGFGISKTLADWSKEGYAIRRVTHEEVRQADWSGCKCPTLQPRLFEVPA